MALERQSIRVFMNPDVHRAVLVLAETAGAEPAKWIEAMVTEHVIREVRAASVLVEKVDVKGLSRLIPAVSGSARFCLPAGGAGEGGEGGGCGEGGLS